MRFVLVPAPLGEPDSFKIVLQIRTGMCPVEMFVHFLLDGGLVVVLGLRGVCGEGRGTKWGDRFGGGSLFSIIIFHKDLLFEFMVRRWVHGEQDFIRVGVVTGLMRIFLALLRISVVFMQIFMRIFVILIMRISVAFV